MNLVGKNCFVFGAAPAVESARAKELKELLQKHGARVDVFSTPAAIKASLAKEKREYFAAFLVVTGALPPPLAVWQAQFLMLPKAPDFYAVVEKALPSSYQKELGIKKTVLANESLAHFETVWGADAENAANPAANNEVTVALSQVDDLVPSSQELTSVQLGDEFSFASDLKVSIHGLEKTNDGGTLRLEMPESVAPIEGRTKINDSSGLTGAIALDMPATAGTKTSLAPELESKNAQRPVSVEATNFNLAPNTGIALDSAPSMSAPSLAPMGEMGASEKTGLSLVGEPSPEAPLNIELSNLDDKDVQTIKKYITLKEREVRERDAAIQVIKGQLRQTQERLEKSDRERRRLQLEHEDLEAKCRVLESERDQHQHHLSKIEAAHQEQLRDFQIRMDNAQFQAQKAERKLEEFREKVRNDIHKIRARERELANRLELQKRDAEALLSAKDERLMQQRREMDRLEFEIESLQERIVDDTHKAEERAGRLVRAIQSLKMAQGVLSSIDEEVVPNALTNKKNDEAA